MAKKKTAATGKRSPSPSRSGSRHVRRTVAIEVREYPDQTTIDFGLKWVEGHFKKGKENIPFSCTPQMPTPTLVFKLGDRTFIANVNQIGEQIAKEFDV